MEHFGKRRRIIDLHLLDFQALRQHMDKRWGLPRITKHIQYTRSVLKYV